jgi:hypothetical protein
MKNNINILDKDCPWNINILDIKDCPWNNIKVGSYAWFFDLDNLTISSHKVLQKPYVTVCKDSYRIECLWISPKKHIDGDYYIGHYDFNGYVYPNKKCACYYDEPNIFKENAKKEHFMIFANKEDCVNFAMDYIHSKIESLSKAKINICKNIL